MSSSDISSSSNISGTSKSGKYCNVGALLVCLEGSTSAGNFHMESLSKLAEIFRKNNNNE